MGKKCINLENTHCKILNKICPHINFQNSCKYYLPNLKFEEYKRWCERCGEEFSTDKKRVKICNNCIKSRKGMKPKTYFLVR